MNESPNSSAAGQEAPSKTQEYALRAMVANYREGNLWDRLDARVCLGAADEIYRLRLALAQRDAGEAPREPLPEGLTDEVIDRLLDEHGLYKQRESILMAIKVCLHRQCAALSASAPPQPVQDKGPWRVAEHSRQRFLVSDDFEHDVSLHINGDFGNEEKRAAYAEWLCAKLNAAPGAAEQPAPAPQAPEVGVEPVGVAKVWVTPSGFQTFATFDGHAVPPDTKLYTAEQLSSLRESHEMLEWLLVEWFDKEGRLNQLFPHGDVCVYTKDMRRAGIAAAMRGEVYDPVPALRSAMAAKGDGK